MNGDGQPEADRANLFSATLEERDDHGNIMRFLVISALSADATLFTEDDGVSKSPESRVDSAGNPVQSISY